MQRKCLPLAKWQFALCIRVATSHTWAMRIESLHIGLRVHHPEYGDGVVKTLSEHAAEILFPGGLKTVEPQSAGLRLAEAQATLTGLEKPLSDLIKETVEALAARLGVERADEVVDGLAARWRGGKMVLHPNDPALQTKEVDLEVFFHKIVMMRNQFRVLEQKLNAHPQLSEADKIEMQQYISRCYGSMTTFNLLFKDKRDQFSGTGS
jgi:hypothetical protein